MFDYQRIIIILPERLGDSLFHTPSIRFLKIYRPNISIGVIALSPLCADVLKNNPYIDTVYVSPSRSELQRIAADYEAALVLHDHSPARYCATQLNLKTFVVTPPKTPMHRSQNSLEFVQCLLGINDADFDPSYSLFPGADNHAKVAELLASHDYKANSDILIGCHLGCHSIAKRGFKFWRPLAHPKVWPFENFASLESNLRNHNPRFRLVLTGSNAERSLGEKFQKHAPTAIDLIDKTSVLDLAALMEKINLFVSSDTGALHVACARKTGIVALYGPTSPQRTGPHPKSDNCTILRAASISNISVQNVQESILAHPDIAAQLNTPFDNSTRKSVQ